MPQIASKHSEPLRLTIFNHKGGVGKTTLTVNIAYALAELGKSVLLVDTDPQCNLTSYLLDDQVVDELLDNSDKPSGGTIWTALKPLFDGTGNGRTIDPIEIGKIYLLPGDIRLSEYEEFLHDSWVGSFQRRLGGLRATQSISELIDRVCVSRHFDYVFYDTGPNIGPLNRVLLLDSDYFVVPVACDLFSVRALSTLGQTLKRWLTDWNTIASLAPDGTQILAGKPRFLGYIPQRFKVYGQTMASQPAWYLRQIRRRVFSDVAAVLRKIDSKLAPAATADPVVGKVKDFSSLVQLAQKEGVSLWNSSGVPSQRADAKSGFHSIAKYIITHAIVTKSR